MTDFIIEDDVLVRYTGQSEFVEVPQGILKIGDEAFRGRAVRGVTLPESLRVIGNAAFARCECLEEIVIPDRVTLIESCAFENCRALRSLTLPKQLADLGDRAFFCCPLLEEVVFFDRTDGIGSEAFAYCTGLREVVLPRYLLYIGRYVFGHCDSLSCVTYPTNIGDVMKNALFATPNPLRVILPEGTTVIPEGVLRYCQTLSELWIPQSVTKIERGSLAGCRFLSRIKFPNGKNEQLIVDGLEDLAYCPRLVLEDYSLGIRPLFFTVRGDAYDIAVMAGTLERLYNDPNDKPKIYIVKLRRILKFASADISQKNLGADTLGGLLRLVILKYRGLTTVEEIDTVMESGVFSEDAEVMSVLINRKQELGGDDSNMMI